ncbi:MAG: bifunctional phosphoglucose/phosphomannose isomerase [Candidatus Pacebacteria bacterium]|nr:bifunctional phosphoglucose/phosphomannose isomerase [Candidatus Paceibacterota bacterium]
MTNQQNASILDDRSQLATIDPDQALASAESLADQINQVWQERAQVRFENLDNTPIKNIVVAGMGGSALGADVILHLFKDTLAVPLYINRDYQLPDFVDQNTLVVLSSYSGNTEETLACAKEAKIKQARIAVISAGGELSKIAQENHYPAFLIDAKFNPSQQPRMAVAYSIMAFIVILSAAKLLDFDEHHLLEIIDLVNQRTEALKIENPQEKNQAKLLAFLCLERRPILVGAEFLEGALHTACNQFNENAKIFADYKIIPEINHHLLEGLSFPKNNALNHFFIFFQSKLYHPRNHKRLELTQQFLEKQGIDSILINLESENKLTQVFELITLTTFANIYLAFLENINPCPIPSVDWFKEQLSK